MTKVLIAEDDLNIQRLLQAILDRCGYEHVSVPNGEECLKYLGAGHEPGILLLDLMMPGMGGMDVLRQLGSLGHSETLPTVVISVRNELEVVKQALTLGAWDYVLKPFQFEEFKLRLADLVCSFDLAQVQSILKSLTFPDKKLFHLAGLGRHSDKTSHVYQTEDRGKQICVVVPLGQSPWELAKLSLDAIEQQMFIYRKFPCGWRKVWPKWPFS